MTSAAEWALRIKAWQESGLRAEEFAAGKDYRAKTLVWWSSELKRRARRVGGLALSKTTPRKGKGSVKMARVVETPKKQAGLTVRVGAAVVEVTRGFDPELLSEVVIVLGAAR